MFYEPLLRDLNALPHDPFKALIAPRPIGWISTVDAAGRTNLAPYSYFNAFCQRPMIVGFSSDGKKDSCTIAQETGEFVWSMATFDTRNEMNATSAPLARRDSEFNYSGLETAASKLVRPPRVARSPASLECKVVDVIRLRDVDGQHSDNYLVIGQAIGVHIDDRFIKNGMVDTAAMRPIARCGYQDYAVVDKVFSLTRPTKVVETASG